MLDLDVGPDGNLYVAQQFIPHVAVFSPAGEAIRAIGRAGGGPGEFDGWPVKLGWIGDTLWAYDHSATKLFGADGRESRRIQFSHRIGAEGSRFEAGAPLADGSFLGRRVLSGDISKFYEADSLSVPRFDADGRLIEVIARIAQPLRVPLQDGSYASHPLASWSGVSWVPTEVTKDGTALILVRNIRSGAAATFDLVKVGIDGHTQMARQIRYEPKPVSSSEQDWLRETFSGWVAGDYLERPSRFLSEATLERRRRAAAAAIEFPPYHPPVRRIVAGEDGTIWVLRELELPDRVDRWEVYGPGGALEGSIRITTGRSHGEPWAPHLNILWADREQVWGTTVDELDVPYIHRFEIDRGC
ncbi:MAG: hypothetical protein HKN72_01420 [Gemmatimonadetes bacterium]|nr:hypothetical protein [Gemmatimonadota bacterium]